MAGVFHPPRSSNCVTKKERKMADKEKAGQGTLPGVASQQSAEPAGGVSQEPSKGQGEVQKTQEKLIPESVIQKRIDELTREKKELEEKYGSLEEQALAMQQQLEYLNNLIAGVASEQPEEEPSPLEQWKQQVPEAEPYAKLIEAEMERRLKPVKSKLEEFDKLRNQQEYTAKVITYEQQIESSLVPVVKELGMENHELLPEIVSLALYSLAPIVEKTGRLPNQSELRSAIEASKARFDGYVEKAKKSLEEQALLNKGAGSVGSRGGSAPKPVETHPAVSKFARGEINMDEAIEEMLKG